MRSPWFLVLLFTLTACGKDEPTSPDSAHTNRSAIVTPGKPEDKKGVGTSTQTDTNTNPGTRPVDPDKPVDPDVPPPNPALTDEELIAAALVKGNAIRMENNVGELELDEKLSLAAQRHAEDMKARKYFDHKSPEGKTPVDRVKAAGAEYRGIGENIAMGIATDVDELFKLWMESKPHKEGLLQKAWTKHGMGYKDGYWVHVFAN